MVYLFLKIGDLSKLMTWKIRKMNTIGRKDSIDFPELGINDVKVKIDTGAYGCALHCHHIELENETTLRFKILDPSYPSYEDKFFYTSNYSVKNVKNSGGVTESRYAIKTPIIIFNKIYQVEFSLTSREDMKTPVLLGRKFLSGRFIVDVAQLDLSLKLKKKQI